MTHQPTPPTPALPVMAQHREARAEILKAVRSFQPCYDGTTETWVSESRRQDSEIEGILARHFPLPTTPAPDARLRELAREVCECAGVSTIFLATKIELLAEHLDSTPEGTAAQEHCENCDRPMQP